MFLRVRKKTVTLEKNFYSSPDTLYNPVRIFGIVCLNILPCLCHGI
ncbi:hypothetical protein LEP1GSC125_3486 [Leptospira mayottensis 200901122]|uniref:Uncharacterized protein n=1 Tax=Leptospira mayottensis 200901122 TaxID=1193010 RepID=A0AA87MQP9_9LEPT|nr:hypothetical protein LEP1GSC125_3486 [Leptospira mayottensis 200901122]